MLNRLRDLIAAVRSDLCSRCEGVKTFRVVDLNGHVLYVHDEGLANALGYSMDEFRTHLFVDFCHQSDCCAIYVATARMIEHHTIESVNFRVRHVDGHYVSVRGYGQPLVENGEVVGFATMYVIRPFVSLEDIFNKASRRAENTKLCTG